MPRNLDKFVTETLRELRSGLGGFRSQKPIV